MKIQSENDTASSQSALYLQPFQLKFDFDTVLYSINDFLNKLGFDRPDLFLKEFSNKKSKSKLATVSLKVNKGSHLVKVMKPVFPGGEKALLSFLSENVQYPDMAKKNAIQGRVICQFIVNRDGTIVDIDVIRGVDPYLDNEVIRILKLMPNWLPGKQQGKVVRVKYTLPVNFKLFK